uniref:Uncharacterized protein n=1 Tax=Dicentrarchus labrax TaxID=13489 RepID=A0A8C4GII5_DICLA
TETHGLPSVFTSSSLHPHFVFRVSSECLHFVFRDGDEQNHTVLFHLFYCRYKQEASDSCPAGCKILMTEELKEQLEIIIIIIITIIFHFNVLYTAGEINL